MPAAKLLSPEEIRAIHMDPQGPSNESQADEMGKPPIDTSTPVVEPTGEEAPVREAKEEPKAPKGEEPKSSAGGAALRGYGQGVTANFGDKYGAGLQGYWAALAHLLPRSSNALGLGVDTRYLDEMKPGAVTSQAFKENSDELKRDEEQHPLASGGGKLAGGLNLQLALPGGSSALKRIASFAGQGGAAGLGGSIQPGSTLQDALVGTGVGTVLGGAGAGVGEGISAGARPASRWLALKALGLIPSSVRGLDEAGAEKAGEVALQHVSPFRSLRGNVNDFNAGGDIAGKEVGYVLDRADRNNPMVPINTLAKDVTANMPGRVPREANMQAAADAARKIEFASRAPDTRAVPRDPRIDKMIQEAVKRLKAAGPNATPEAVRNAPETVLGYIAKEHPEIELGKPARIKPSGLNDVKQQLQSEARSAYKQAQPDIQGDAKMALARNLRAATIKAAGAEGPELEQALQRLAPYKAVGPIADQRATMAEMLNHFGYMGAGGGLLGALSGSDPEDRAERAAIGMMGGAALRSSPGRAAGAKLLQGLGASGGFLGGTLGREVGGMTASALSGQVNKNNPDAMANANIQMHAPRAVKLNVAQDPTTALAVHRVLQRQNPAYAGQTAKTGTQQDNRRP